MVNGVNDRAFNAMQTVAADKTRAELFPQEVDKSTKGVHNMLMAAGMSPAYGNVADLADATLYALEGELGEAAWSAASAVPIIGQMVAGKRALKAAKESGEEMVTLYRGVDQWYPGKMVKDGRFIGKQYKNPVTKKTLLEGRTYVTPDYKLAHYYSTMGSPSRKGSLVLEFEVPKSFINKNAKHMTEGYEYLFQKGIPKGFLKKVHR